MALSHSPRIVMDGLVLALDAANPKSYPSGSGYYYRAWSGGWSGSYGTAANSFDGNLSTSSGGAGGTFSATYTFSGGLNVSGTVRVYVVFGASSGQVNGRTGVILVDGIDISSKMAAANLYGTAGWVDVTSEVGSIFNTIVLNGTSGSTNPGIYAIEVDGQILVDNTTLTDLSGNGNNGTLTNGPTYSSANGGSIAFDGTNDYSSHPYSSLLDLGTQFTISSFIKFNNLSTLSPIFAAPNVNTGVFTEGYQFYYNTGTIYGMNTNTLRLQFGQNNWAWNIYASNGITITDNNWHFVSVTASNLNTSNPTITFYIDGNSITGTFWNAASKAAIRYSSNINSPRVASIFYPTSYDGPYYFYGNIAQVSIYNRALTAAEVSQNYNALKSRYV